MPKTLKVHLDQVFSVSFSPDSQILASGSLDGTVKLWKKDGKELKTFKKLNTGIQSVSFSYDGKTLASGGDDNMVRLWNRSLSSSKLVR
ncbi:WD40 repeat domain-containing protein [Nostoc sp.]|uniref:WD40 repeat domain-containing protein n=1 Tax=Nostoc sp. TaxID=1180 RepID=UPI002FFC4D19